MELTFEESQKLPSIRQRYVNMTKRFMPAASDFNELLKLITELHNIHSQERKIFTGRVKQVREAKDLADASACNPSKFFHHRSLFSQFKAVWREVNNEIYTAETKEQLAAAYALESQIARIDVGYHINRTGKERGEALLAVFNASETATRITFADGTFLDIPSLEAADIETARESFREKVHPKMIPVL